MKQINGEVKVNLKDAKGAGVEHVRPVTYHELENGDDVLKLAQTPEKLQELIDAANYGFNLKARAKVSASIKQDNQGPGVAIDRLLAQMEKNFKKSGKPFDAVAKRAYIVANLDQFGIEG